MLPDKKNIDSAPDLSLDRAREFCEMIPGAASVWKSDGSMRLLNEAARRLINFTEAAFVDRPFFWLDRVHPDDREMYGDFLDNFDRQKGGAACDFRFFPRDADNPKWIREQCVVAGEAYHGTDWEIISSFTDISDLKFRETADAEADESRSTKLSMHDFQNWVHTIAMEIELAQSELRSKFDSPEVQPVIEVLNRSLSSLREQVVNIVESRTSHDLLGILEEVIRKMRNELARQGVKLRLVRQGPLPKVEGDKDQLRDALERVLASCGAMVKRGGVLRIDAGPKEVGNEAYAEVKVTPSPAVAVEIGDAQQGQGEGNRLRFGILLAGEVLRRYRGRVSFEQVSNKQGQVIILFKASSS